MKWNRTTVKAVVITFVTIIATSFFIKWTFDHDGETITLGGGDPASSVDRRPGLLAHGARAGTSIPASGLPWVLEEELPVEGQATLALIDQGGPFPFRTRTGRRSATSRGCCPTTRAATTRSTR